MTDWKLTINLSDFFHDESMDFLTKRDTTVKRLRKSSWMKDRDQFDDLVGFVDELANAEDAEQFDSAWAAIYDEADADKVWIKTR